MASNGFAERREHDGAGDPGMSGDREGVARTVVQPGQDLAVGAVEEPVVGEVGLPGLVRLIGFEPDVGALGPFGRVRGDRAGPDQDPVDRRPRQGRGVMVGQVPADGVGTGVQTGLGQLFTQAQHQLHGLWRSRPR
jgi:hypothetical protein